MIKRFEPNVVRAGIFDLVQQFLPETRPLRLQTIGQLQHLHIVFQAFNVHVNQEWIVSGP